VSCLLFHISSPLFQIKLPINFSIDFDGAGALQAKDARETNTERGRQA
jgi:hypothetical protein